MSIFGSKDKSDASNHAWPLRFDSFDFDVRCYNTLRCYVVFMNQQMSTHLDEPSGEPHSPDWKDRWKGGFIVSPDQVFPPPVQIHWTALDGVERSADIDLESIFPERLILHNAKEDEVVDGWGLRDHSRDVEILMEINDQTISVYMRSWVLLKQPRDPSVRNSDSLRDLMLAWTKTY
jgi:hypothetical protein